MDIFPEVNLLFGTHEIDQLYDLVYEAKTKGERIVSRIRQCALCAEVSDCQRGGRDLFHNFSL